jgi:hypothetical protein
VYINKYIVLKMILMKESGIKVCKMKNGLGHLTNAIRGGNLCYNNWGVYDSTMVNMVNND